MIMTEKNRDIEQRKWNKSQQKGYPLVENKNQ